MRAIWIRLVLISACVCVVLLAEARFTALDGFTLKMPHPLRAIVATLTVHENGASAAALDRALTIDPDNTAAWGRRCSAYVGKDATERLYDCQRAVALRASAANLRGEASALEESGNFCAAEATYRAALTKADVVGQRAYVMRDQARTGLACGDVSGSLTALRSAEEIDTRNAAEAGQNASGRDGLAADRGYMAVVYDRMNQPQKAKELCAEANPAYASCTCELTGSGVSCAQTVAQTK
jgi:tetratricopeptide (TPR) repeat protein